METYYDLQAEISKERLSCDGVILEVGCGKGYLLSRLSKISSYKVGVDLSKKRLNRQKTF